MRARQVMPRFLAQLAGLVAITLLVAACGGKREAFLGTRVEDSCGAQWPICDKIAGCLLGDSNYLEGRFPGSRLVGIQVFEPSTVRMSFQLENVGAAGTETALNFFEDRCRARTRVTISGRSFVGENDTVGFVKREAELSGVGDHLIEFSSDVRATYLLKIDVIPTRLKSTEGQP
ncbi:MAG: hypothetical protein H6Q89_1616 [Myxococcaceae bacterium]|nr:hypothetical protein [Myxococcaceae bacterium]